MTALLADHTAALGGLAFPAIEQPA